MTLPMLSADLPILTEEFTARMVSRLFRQEMTQPPAAVRERVRHALIDWVAVSLAGAGEDVTRIARQVELAEGWPAVASPAGAR